MTKCKTYKAISTMMVVFGIFCFMIMDDKLGIGFLAVISLWGGHCYQELAAEEQRKETILSNLNNDGTGND